MIYANWYEVAKNHKFTSLLIRFEPGYCLFTFIAAKSGLKFSQFLMLYSSIGLYLILRSFYDYCRYPCLAALLYFIYPFFMDAEQIRNFMAEAIVFFSLRYLRKFSKKNFFSFVILIFLAASFHVAAYISFLYLFIYLRNYQYVLKVSVFITVIFSFAFTILPNLWRRVVSDTRLLEYIINGSSYWKVLGYEIFSILITLTGYVYFRKLTTLKSSDRESFLLNLFPISLIMTSTIIVTSQGYRFFRNMFLILYVGLINIGILKNDHFIRFNSSQLMATFLSLFVCVYFFLHHMWIGTSAYEHILIPMLKSSIEMLRDFFLI